MPFTFSRRRRFTKARRYSRRLAPSGFVGGPSGNYMPRLRSSKSLNVAWRPPGRKQQLGGLQFPGFPTNNAAPFSKMLHTWLTYEQIGGISCGAAGLFGSDQLFRLNSLFDPDQSGVGHQPYFYDQLTGIYSRYKVLRCRVNLWVQNPTDKTNGAYVGVCVQSSDDTNTPMVSKLPQTIAERPNSNLIYISGTGEQSNYSQFEVPLHHILGLTRREFLDDVEDTCAAVGANPSRVAILGLAMVDPGGAAGAGSQTVTYRVQLQFYVQMFGLLTQVQS